MFNYFTFYILIIWNLFDYIYKIECQISHISENLISSISLFQCSISFSPSYNTCQFPCLSIVITKVIKIKQWQHYLQKNWHIWNICSSHSRIWPAKIFYAYKYTIVTFSCNFCMLIIRINILHWFFWKRIFVDLSILLFLLSVISGLVLIIFLFLKHTSFMDYMLL